MREQELRLQISGQIIARKVNEKETVFGFSGWTKTKREPRTWSK